MREDDGMNADPVWSRFSDEAYSSMVKFLKEEINLTDACLFSDKYQFRDLMDDEIVQFVLDVICEIDADPQGYEEVMHMLKNKVDEIFFLKYMHTPY